MAFRAFIAAEVGIGPEALGMWGEVEGTGASLKMVNPEITHVTLRFLGDTDEALTGDITAAMEAAVDGQAPFDVELRGLGVFPKPTYIKVVWMGMVGAEPLVDIAKRLDEPLDAIGFKKEKPLKPHLTIARVKGGRNLRDLSKVVEANPDTPFGRFTVDRIILKKSDLTPQGPIYTDVHVAHLKQG